MKKNLSKLFALIMALAMVFALAACGNNSNDTAADTDTTAAEDTTEPAADDSATDETTVVNSADAAAVDTSLLRIGVEGSLDTLSPYDASGNVAGFAYRTGCFDSLWWYDSNNNFVYRLATGYEFNEDGTQITIHLRDDAKFSDGTPVTAADVVASFTYDNEHTGDHTTTLDMSTLTAVDDLTVTCNCTQTATMIESLSLIVVSSAEYTENFTNEDHMYVHPMGSGPYMVDGDWANGTNLTLVRNEYYWDTEDIPFDSVQLCFYDDETTRYMALSSGEVDICYLSDSMNIDSAKSSYDVYTVPVQLVMALMMDTTSDTTPFKNVNIRQAIVHAIDVNTIVTGICGSAYKVATSPVPSASWAYKECAYEYDPALAQEYLQKYYDETGESSFTFTCTVKDDFTKTLATAIQDYLKQVGIDMEIEQMDMASYFPAMINGGMTCTITQYQGSYDPGGVFNSWLGSGILAMNHLEGDLQTLLDTAAESTASQEERTEQFYELQDELYDYAKCLPICEGTYNYVVANANIDLTNTFAGDGWLTLWYIGVNG